MATAEIVKDPKNGRIIKSTLTRDKAIEMVKAREEKRIRLYNEGAKRAVLDKQLIREYGDDAHIVERGMTLQTIASTPDAGKAAVMAAQHLDKAQGLTTDNKTADTVGALAQDFGLVLGQMLDALTSGIDPETLEAIEAEVSESE